MISKVINSCYQTVLASMTTANPIWVRMQWLWAKNKNLITNTDLEYILANRRYTEKEKGGGGGKLAPTMFCL